MSEQIKLPPLTRPDGTVFQPQPTWFPHENGILPFKNPNYLQSLFIGLTFPILHLPSMVWLIVLKPLLQNLWTLVASLCSVVANGFAGYASGFTMPKGAFVVIRKRPKQK